MIGVIIILALFCVGLLTYLLRMMKQIKEINEVLDDVQKGNLDRRIVIHRNTLLTDTCYKINEIMIKTKEQLIISEQSAIRNDKLMTCLSHDIRTPLTSIMVIWMQFIISSYMEKTTGRRLKLPEKKHIF